MAGVNIWALANVDSKAHKDSDGMAGREVSFGYVGSRVAANRCEQMCKTDEERRHVPHAPKGSTQIGNMC
jgi:hypothetical protein